MQRGGEARMLKQPILRDRAYLDWLRTQPCILTGLHATDRNAVDPCHIGTAGKGLKSPDNEALPISHLLHVQAHQSGEVSMLRRCAPDWLIRAAFRAYARELYAEHKDET
jgi:hypothetical protein